MNDADFIAWYITNVMQGKTSLELREFALRARGEQTTEQTLTSAASWSKINKNYNTAALEWLAANWTGSELTIGLPGAVTIRTPITFNANCRFTLQPWTNSSGVNFKTDNTDFNNTPGLTFLNKCELRNIGFDKEKDEFPHFSAIRIDAPSASGESLISDCDFEGFRNNFAITGARGSLEVSDCIFNDAPGGVCVRFYNNSESDNPAPSLKISGSSLLHIAAGSTAVSVGITDGIDGDSYDLGDIEVTGCTMDIGGTILDAKFSLSDKTKVKRLLVQNNSLSGDAKGQDGMNFAIGVQRSGGKVVFDSIELLDNMICLVGNSKEQAGIYLPDKIKVKNFIIKGVVTIDGDADAFPIIISNDIAKSNIKIIGITTNYLDSDKCGLGGIAKLKDGEYKSVDNDDGNFNVAG